MKAGEDAEGFRRQEPLVDHIGLGNQAEAAVSKLRRLRREEQLRADPGWQERVMGIDQQIEGVTRGVNRVVGKQRLFESQSPRHAKFLQIFNLSNSADKLLI